MESSKTSGVLIELDEMTVLQNCGQNYNATHSVVYINSSWSQKLNNHMSLIPSCIMEKSAHYEPCDHYKPYDHYKHYKHFEHFADLQKHNNARPLRNNLLSGATPCKTCTNIRNSVRDKNNVISGTGYHTCILPVTLPVIGGLFSCSPWESKNAAIPRTKGDGTHVGEISATSQNNPNPGNDTSGTGNNPGDTNDSGGGGAYNGGGGGGQNPSPQPLLANDPVYKSRFPNCCCQHPECLNASSGLRSCPNPMSPRAGLLRDCGHRCICEPCATKHNPSICPSCGETVNSWFPSHTSSFLPSLT